MYKLIAIDLDGTLLDDNKIIPRENIDLVNELIDRGYKLMFATGRRYTAAKQFVNCFNEDLIIAANNGNIVRHSKDDELVDALYLDKKHLDYVLREGKNLDLHPTIHVNGYDDGVDMIYELEKDDPRYHNYLVNEDRIKGVKDLGQENYPILSIVYLGEYKKLEELNRTLQENYPREYRTYLMKNITIADGLLEVVNPRSGKWKSVKEYGESLGIKPEEIIAIGDDSNDIEMVKNAGLGIGMKNGVEKLRQAADLITDFTNNDAGVARILRKVLDL